MSDCPSYTVLSDVIYSQLQQMANPVVRAFGETGQVQQMQQQQEGSTEDGFLLHLVVTQAQQEGLVAPDEGNAFEASVQQQVQMDFHDPKVMLLNEPHPAHEIETQHPQHVAHHEQEQQQHLLVLHCEEELLPEQQSCAEESYRLLDLTTVEELPEHDVDEAIKGGNTGWQTRQERNAIRAIPQDGFAGNRRRSSSRTLTYETLPSAQTQSRGPAVEYSNLVSGAHNPAEYYEQNLEPHLQQQQQHYLQQLLHSNPFTGSVVSGPRPSALQFVLPTYNQLKCFPSSATIGAQPGSPPKNIPTKESLQSLHVMFRQGLEPPMHLGLEAPQHFSTPKHLSTQLLKSHKDLVKDIFNEAKPQPKRSFANLECKTLGDISNNARGHASSMSSYTSVASPTQRVNKRARHNIMERDRRRRVRVCCDELNHLVPFCTVETDKATTLQWSVAFLRFIKKTHGETLKKAFERSFCEDEEQSTKPKETNRVTA